MKIIDAETISSLIGEVRDEVVGWRRHLHRHPEFAFEEVETSRFVYETLESFGSLEVSRPTKTSVVARLVGEGPGRTVAIRADMDALPIEEETGLPFASENEGVMHACGHDGHTSILLGAAKVLADIEADRLAGEVRFLFQHAEEVYPGGASELIEAGALDGVDVVVGLHLSSLHEVGTVSVAPGSMLASAGNFDIVVKGDGGHAAWPQLGVDPVVVAAEIVGHLQQLVSRETDARDALVVSVTRVAGGDAHNIIPDAVELAGTVRALEEEVPEEVPEAMERIVKGVAQAHRAEYRFEYEKSYRAVINDEKVTRVVEQTAREVVGDEALEQARPILGGEDFADYGRVAPACFFFLGARNEEKGITAAHHSARFDIDEDALEIGVKMFVHAAFKLLEDAEETGK